MKKAYLLLSGLLIAVTVTAFAFTSPDDSKKKRKAKAEVKKECVSTQSQTGCQGHAAAKASCGDQTKHQCQKGDSGKCQGTCDKANCKGNCTCTGDQAKCAKHNEVQKK